MLDFITVCVLSMDVLVCPLVLLLVNQEEMMWFHDHTGYVQFGMFLFCLL